MKTDDLIDVLSTNVEAVDTRRVVLYILAGILIGVATAILLTVLALGIRPDLQDTRVLVFMLAKAAFGIAIVGLAAAYLVKLIRPGGESRFSLLIPTLPFITIMTFASISLVSAPRSHWESMLMGDEWLECIVSIPAIAIVPFAVIMWAVRQAAPTDLFRTGALAGLVAGGVSAAAYALHCTDDTMPFVALWYGSTIVMCTLAGAMLGPRLLRW